MSRRIRKDDLKGVTKSQVSKLKFLDRFIKTMNWTKPQFAEKIGMTKANVYHWFKEDDIQLTTLHSAFEKIGYHVEFSMEMPKSNDDEIINIELDEKDIVTDSSIGIWTFSEGHCMIMISTSMPWRRN